MAWIKWLLILRRLIISHSYIWRVRKGERRDQFSELIQTNFRSISLHPWVTLMLFWGNRHLDILCPTSSYCCPFSSSPLPPSYSVYRFWREGVVWFQYLNSPSKISLALDPDLLKFFLQPMLAVSSPDKFLALFPLKWGRPTDAVIHRSIPSKVLSCVWFVHHFFICSSNSRGTSVPLVTLFSVYYFTSIFPVVFVCLFQIKCNGS